MSAELLATLSAPVNSVDEVTQRANQVITEYIVANRNKDYALCMQLANILLSTACGMSNFAFLNLQVSLQQAQEPAEIDAP